MADDHPPDELTSREPTVEDLRELCRALNDRGAKYVVVGGFAIRAAGSSPLSATAAWLLRPSSRGNTGGHRGGRQDCEHGEGINPRLAHS